MLIIRFEKESLNDYMIYHVDDGTAVFSFINDQHTHIAYPNDDSYIMRVYFKIVFYNTHKEYVFQKVTDYINKIFDTTEKDWTICYLEKMFNESHKITAYFYSNKIRIAFKVLKDLVSSFHIPNIVFDESIYYRKHPKYKDFIFDILPNQTYEKVKKPYKLFLGSLEYLIM